MLTIQDTFIIAHTARLDLTLGYNRQVDGLTRYVESRIIWAYNSGNKTYIKLSLLEPNYNYILTFNQDSFLLNVASCFDYRDLTLLYWSESTRVKSKTLGLPLLDRVITSSLLNSNRSTVERLLNTPVTTYLTTRLKLPPDTPNLLEGLYSRVFTKIDTYIKTVDECLVVDKCLLKTQKTSSGVVLEFFDTLLYNRPHDPKIF